MSYTYILRNFGSHCTCYLSIFLGADNFLFNPQRDSNLHLSCTTAAIACVLSVVVYLLAISLCVLLRFTPSDYFFGIFQLIFGTLFVCKYIINSKLPSDDYDYLDGQ